MHGMSSYPVDGGPDTTHGPVVSVEPGERSRLRWCTIATGQGEVPGGAAELRTKTCRCAQLELTATLRLTGAVWQGFHQNHPASVRPCRREGSSSMWHERLEHALHVHRAIERSMPTRFTRRTHTGTNGFVRIYVSSTFVPCGSSHSRFARASGGKLAPRHFQQLHPSVRSVKSRGVPVQVGPPSTKCVDHEFCVRSHPADGGVHRRIDLDASLDSPPRL